MMKKILLFLLVLLSGGYIQSPAFAVADGETVLEYELEWYWSFVLEEFFEDSLSVEAAEAICLRMFEYAALKHVQLSFGDYSVNSSWCSVSASTAISVAFKIAEQVSLKPRQYSCEDEERIKFMDQEARAQFGRYFGFDGKREGEARILCSDTGSYCIANQNVVYKNQNLVLVTCVPMSGLIIKKEADGSCKIYGTTQHKPGVFVSNDVSLDYFDENCYVKNHN